MNFGEKLRFWIEKRFGTLAKFCRYTGHKYSKVHNYTTGLREPDLEFYRIIIGLGCDIHWLLTTTETVNLVKEPGAEYGGEESEREKIRRLEAEVKELRKKLEMIQKITGEGVRD